MLDLLQEQNVVLTKDIAASAVSFLFSRKYSQIAVIVDENTKRDCYPLIASSLPPHQVVEIKSGEENKTLQTCAHIWQTLTDTAFDRKGLVINLGGGVIGDMGGFCASTYKRGIDFIQIPTTLLSQVDASVGGKLGIDFNAFKNHIGIFRIPDAVLISTQFLGTLPQAEIRSGFAEIIKHCLIADAIKWKEVSSKGFENQDWDDLVAHSILIKSKIATEDPKEMGLRKILNFGHTVGHAIESYFLEIPGKRLLHGEAIAIGMVAEAFLSYEKGFISLDEVEEIKAYIVRVYGHHPISKSDIDALLPLTVQDKKNEHNKVLASLLQKVGEANYNIELSIAEMAKSIEYYNA